MKSDLGRIASGLLEQAVKGPPLFAAYDISGLIDKVTLELHVVVENDRGLRRSPEAHQVRSTVLREFNALLGRRRIVYEEKGNSLYLVHCEERLKLVHSKK